MEQGGLGSNSLPPPPPLFFSFSFSKFRTWSAYLLSSSILGVIIAGSVDGHSVFIVQLHSGCFSWNEWPPLVLLSIDRGGLGSQWRQPAVIRPARWRSLHERRLCCFLPTSCLLRGTADPLDQRASFMNGMGKVVQRLWEQLRWGGRAGSAEGSRQCCWFGDGQKESQRTSG